MDVNNEEVNGRRKHVCANTIPRSAAVDLFACLAHELRLQILRKLADSPKDVSSLAEALDLEIDRVSHHLRPLRACGLVEFSRIKQTHVFRLSEGVMASSEPDDKLHFDVSSAEGDQLKFTLATRRGQPSSLPKRLVTSDGEASRHPGGGDAKRSRERGK